MMKKLLIIIISNLVVLSLLGACAPVVQNPMPMNHPRIQARPDLEKEYRIQVGDQLDIKLFYNPELNELVIVRPDGRISLQLVGEILVLDMTAAELAKLITERYGSELRRPEATVIVRSFNAQKVYVDGEVNKPGLLTLTGPLTLLQSISMAGGIKDSARTNELILIRRGADHRPMVTTLDMTKILDGTDMAQDILLAPYDIVYVPKSSITDVNVWVDQYVRKNIPVSTGFGISWGLNQSN